MSSCGCSSCCSCQKLGRCRQWLIGFAHVSNESLFLFKFEMTRGMSVHLVYTVIIRYFVLQLSPHVHRQRTWYRSLLTLMLRCFDRVFCSHYSGFCFLRTHISREMEGVKKASALQSLVGDVSTVRIELWHFQSCVGAQRGAPCCLGNEKGSHALLWQRCQP